MILLETTDCPSLSEGARLTGQTRKHWACQGRRCRQPAPNSATSAGASGDRGAAAACSETLLWASLLGTWLSRGGGGVLLWHQAHPDMPATSEACHGPQRRQPQVRRLRPEPPTAAAPPSSVVSPAGPLTPTAPAVTLMEDKGGGCWGRVLQGSPRGPLSASSQNQLFVGTIY